MKIIVTVDRDIALCAGQDAYGPVIIEIPAAGMSEAQRATLIRQQRSRAPAGADYSLADALYHGGVQPSGGSYAEPTASADGVLRHLDRISDIYQDAEERAAAEAAEREARDRARREEREREHVRIAALPEDEWRSWYASQVASRPSGQYESACESLARRIISARERCERERLAATAERERRELAAAEERDAWVREHGSERLRQCLAEGIECMAIYSDERLARARPGWRWWADVEIREHDEPRNPPAWALAGLLEARKTDKAATLRHYRSTSEDPETGEEEVHQGYLATSTLLDEEIVMILRRTDAADAEKS